MFPYGTDGYNIDLKQINGRSSLTALQYYKYRLMVRENNYLLLCRELFNVFIVDMFVKIESERALYIKLHQSKLRSEEYNTLRDAVTNDGDISQMGRLVVLPSSFTGSPRYYHEKMQDGMAYIRKYGTADFFITMTCNPRWKEIQDALLPGQHAMYRHDVVARVFHMKVKRLMDMIKKKEVFGAVKCYMYSIEWQKRGNYIYITNNIVCLINMIL